MYKAGVSLAFALLLSACAGGSPNGTVPAQRSAESVPTPAVPAKPDAAVPPRPEALLRTTPAPPPPYQAGTRAPESAHPPFFSGEAALNNGVYYLNMPSGTPFGYYSYLSTPSYIYHFDLGYEYYTDANDGAGGIYFYDFASSHWWYTNRTWSFPYIYDFSRSATLYYYPASNDPGHYTANPRYFYDFAIGQIITLPGPSANPSTLNVNYAGPPATNVTFSEPNYSGAFTVDASQCATVATVTGQSPTFQVTGLAAGTCYLIATDTNGGRSAVKVVVTTTGIVGQ